MCTKTDHQRGIPLSKVTKIILAFFIVLIPSALLAWGVLPAVLVGGSSVVPGNDANTLIMIHSNTTDGSTTFENSAVGLTGVTVTANGHIEHSAAAGAAKFGSSGVSVSRDGSGDYLKMIHKDEFDIGLGDYTFESWVRFVSGTGAPDNVMINVGKNTSPSDILIMYTTGGTLWHYQYSSTTSYGIDTWTPTEGRYYHYAASRKDGILRIFIDGVQQLASPNGKDKVYDIPDPSPVNTGPDGVWIGSRGDGALCWRGQMDEIKFDNVARYTSGFSVPAGPYGD